MGGIDYLLYLLVFHLQVGVVVVFAQGNFERVFQVITPFVGKLEHLYVVNVFLQKLMQQALPHYRSPKVFGMLIAFAEYFQLVVLVAGYIIRFFTGNHIHQV